MADTIAAIATGQQVAAIGIVRMSGERSIEIADRLFRPYAGGRLKDAKDRKLLDFADLFEDRFVRQGPEEDRSIEETLDLGWELFTALDLDQITRISRKYIEKYMPKKA